MLELYSTENSEKTFRNILPPFISKKLIAAAGFNIETPIIDAIIGNLNGTLPRKKNSTDMIECNVCGCELSSAIILKPHLNGCRHKKRLKALKIMAQLKDKGVQLGDGKHPKVFKCEVCSLTVNSALQLKIHLSGGKHKKKAAQAGFYKPQSNNIKNYEPNKYSGPQSKRHNKAALKLIRCDTCNVFVNSRTQYNQHLISKKHLSKMNL